MTNKSLLTVVGTLIAVALFGVVYLNYQNNGMIGEVVSHYPDYFNPEAEDYYLLETVQVDYMTLSYYRSGGKIKHNNYLYTVYGHVLGEDAEKSYRFVWDAKRVKCVKGGKNIAYVYVMDKATASEEYLVLLDIDPSIVLPFDPNDKTYYNERPWDGTW